MEAASHGDTAAASICVAWRQVVAVGYLDDGDAVVLIAQGFVVIQWRASHGGAGCSLVARGGGGGGSDLGGFACASPQPPAPEAE